VVERGGLLIRDGRIAQVFEGDSPDPKQVQAEPVEGSGKTLLPGLLDAAVALELPGGVPAGDPRGLLEWNHVAYLYSGVTMVRASGAASPQLTQLAAKVLAGERLGSEILFGEPAAGSVISLLAALEAETNPRAELLERSLVQQAAARGLLERTRPLVAKAAGSPEALRVRMAEVAAMGERVVAGSGAGRMFVVHGPGIHRELALLVEAGLTPSQALQAATGRAARAMGVAGRAGLLRPGLAADLLLVDGNPLRDITDTERISAVFFRGERIARAELFEEEE
jgi:imidazolonepropionase-like amidohydrolase